jgi:hypothetical protein
MRRMAALLALLAASALGGCGGSDKPAGSGGGGGVATTTAGAAPTTAAPASNEPAVLEDGRHPVYLRTVDPGRRAITFDLVQFFTGDAATRAAAEDGKESPPPNDVYIRNVNARLRTLPVAADAPITANTLTAQSSGSATKNVPLTLDELAGYFPAADADPFWITVEGGQVTRMAQQYLP